LRAIVAVKLAVLLPAGTETDAGTVRRVVLLLTVTVVETGAACVRVTVHVVEGVLGFEIAAGLQAILDTITAIVKVTLLVPPYPVALRVMLWVEDVNVPEVTVKLADLEPAGTVTEEGTLSTGALLVRLTDSASGALLASVTVQVLLETLPMIWVPATVGRTQVTEESGTAGTTVRELVCDAPP
jgi:hypothetical protein